MKRSQPARKAKHVRPPISQHARVPQRKSRVAHPGVPWCIAIDGDILVGENSPENLGSSAVNLKLQFRDTGTSGTHLLHATNSTNQACSHGASALSYKAARVAETLGAFG